MFACVVQLGKGHMNPAYNLINNGKNKTAQISIIFYLKVFHNNTDSNIFKQRKLLLHQTKFYRPYAFILMTHFYLHLRRGLFVLRGFFMIEFGFQNPIFKSRGSFGKTYQCSGQSMLV